MEQPHAYAAHRSVQKQKRNDALLSLARGLAVIGIVLGLLLGNLYAVFNAQLCFAACPPAVLYIAAQGQNAVSSLVIYWIIEALTILMFWFYCAATTQEKRALRVTGLITLLGLVGLALLYLFTLIERTQFPISPNSPFNETLLKLWALLWGYAVMAMVTAWAVIIARLIWSARDVTHPTPDTNQVD